MYEEELKRHKDPKFLSMLEIRKKLPAYELKDLIADTIESNQVVVISGETGCGKVIYYMMDRLMYDHIEHSNSPIRFREDDIKEEGIERIVVIKIHITTLGE
jgi:ABC-type phosphate transport system ATPase subunit